MEADKAYIHYFMGVQVNIRRIPPSPPFFLRISFRSPCQLYVRDIQPPQAVDRTVDNHVPSELFASIYLC